jgi:soluble epoxide hydrolase/lipid-phosphate phosphatase
MSFDFKGKVAIVTGAGGGLGYAYAAYLAEKGAKVVVNDLGGGTFGVNGQPTASVAEEAAARIRAAGGEAIANTDSVSELASARRMVDQAIDTWGRVDIIVNNAGIASTQVFPDVDAEEVQRHLGVHVLGALNTMRAAWPHMVKQGFGRIINTASNSTLGFSPQISYPSMKSALFGLSKSVALLGKAHNIGVNVILPAAFTRLSAMLPACDFRDRLEREFQPDRLAPVVAWLAHETCDVSGEIFSVGGGKFGRVVFAAAPMQNVDMSMESVAEGMKRTFADHSLSVLNNTFDDLRNLGFSDEECAMFHDMSATQGARDGTVGEGAHVAVKKDSIDQVWTIVVKTPIGDQASTLVLKSEGNRLTGVVANEQYGSQVVESGELQGETLQWLVNTTIPMPLTLTYTGTLDANDNMRGQVEMGMFGTMDFTASPLHGEEAAKARSAATPSAAAEPAAQAEPVKRVMPDILTHKPAILPDFSKPRMVPVNGIELAIYEGKPEGEAHPYPVILCHGYPELGYSWRNQVKPLVEAGFHVLVPDHRGFGNSTVLPRKEDYVLSEVLKDICGLLDYFGYEKGIIVGHDFGGAITWGMGLYHPDRVAGLIACNSPFADMPMNPLDLYQQLYGPKNYFAYFQTQECEDKFNEDPSRTFRFYMRRDTGKGTNLSRSRQHDAESIGHVHWIHDDESTWPGEVILDDTSMSYYSNAYRKTGFGPGLNWYRCLPYGYDLQKQTFPNGLPKITAPVLAVEADLDFIAAYHFYDLLDNFCTDYEKTLVSNAGHWVQQENPEELNIVLVDWLARRYL